VLAGCGFVGAGNVSHTKPDGFVLRGYVRVTTPVSGGGTGGCRAPVSLADIAPGAPVRVSDPGGKGLASGELGSGVSDPAGNCNFPFEIRAVPGGQTSYVIAVGQQVPVRFPARDLREDKPAVIVLPG
jgi:hypothetical protein